MADGQPARPDDPVAATCHDLTLRARTAWQSGDLAAAGLLADRVLRLDEDHVGALRVKGDVLASQGRHDAAAALLGAALKRRGPHIGLGLDLARHLEALGLEAEALVWLRRVVDAYPHAPDALMALGSRLLRRGQPGQALPLYTRAAARRPNAVEPLFGLARCLHRLGQFGKAEGCFGRVLDLAPGHAAAATNIGLLRRRRGDLDGAIAWHEAALAADPDLPEAHWNLALARLAAGDLARGLEGYEWRFKVKGKGRLFSHLPDWPGGDLAGRRVLVAAEQGVGDYLHFIRYAPLLRERGAAAVLCEAHPGMDALLRAQDGIDGVRPLGQTTVAEADVQVPVMSLPHRLGLAGATLAERVPYLRAPAGPEVPLPPAEGRRRVGLVWAGSPEHEDDALRSAPLAALRPLWEDTAHQWVSLQLGPATRQMAEAAAPLVDVAAHLTDYGATARLLERLDLVVAVDTSVVHLAGALGRPCLLLLNHHGDWRWPRADGPSAWYAAVSCLRQTPGEGWTALAARARPVLETVLRRGPGDGCLADGPTGEAGRQEEADG